MFIARDLKKVPPKEWYHDPNLTTTYDVSVEQFLTVNDINVPDKWKVNKNR